MKDCFEPNFILDQFLRLGDDIFLKEILPVPFLGRSP